MSPRPPLGSTMTVLRPEPSVLAFYDGRVAGVRAYADEPNWVDDGAYALGIASYAIVDGSEALVYDTHTSLPHARAVRQTLEELGVRTMRVVLSHWHLDHIAGNEAFADCEIIAHAWTAEEMRAHQGAIEGGEIDGPPGISPLILPNRTYEGEMTLEVGKIRIELRHVDVHSRDETLLLLPATGLLLAGDALEDTVTFVAEPEGLERHLDDLGRMSSWDFARILPNHGDRARIAGPGYAADFITATQRYVERLLRCRTDEKLESLDLRSFVAPELEAGWITYFDAYEAVHRSNVAAACGRQPGYGQAAASPGP